MVGDHFYIASLFATLRGADVHLIFCFVLEHGEPLGDQLQQNSNEELPLGGADPNQQQNEGENPDAFYDAPEEEQYLEDASEGKLAGDVSKEYESSGDVVEAAADEPGVQHDEESDAQHPREDEEEGHAYEPYLLADEEQLQLPDQADDLEDDYHESTLQQNVPAEGDDVAEEIYEEHETYDDEHGVGAEDALPYSAAEENEAQEGNALTPIQTGHDLDSTSHEFDEGELSEQVVDNATVAEYGEYDEEYADADDNQRESDPTGFLDAVSQQTDASEEYAVFQEEPLINPGASAGFLASDLLTLLRDGPSDPSATMSTSADETKVLDEADAAPDDYTDFTDASGERFFSVMRSDDIEY